MRVYKIMNMHMSAEPRDDVITHPPFGMHAVTETKMRLTHVEHIHAITNVCGIVVWINCVTTNLHPQHMLAPSLSYKHTHTGQVYHCRTRSAGIPAIVKIDDQYATC